MIQIYLDKIGNNSIFLNLKIIGVILKIIIYLLYTKIKSWLFFKKE
jgi:hypothetical protein